MKTKEKKTLKGELKNWAIGFVYAFVLIAIKNEIVSIGAFFGLCWQHSLLIVVVPLVGWICWRSVEFEAKERELKNSPEPVNPA